MYFNVLSISFFCKIVISSSPNKKYLFLPILEEFVEMHYNLQSTSFSLIFNGRLASKEQGNKFMCF